MSSRLCAFLVWALVAGSVLFWGLRVAAHAPAAPARVNPVGETLALGGDLTRLLGTAPVVQAAAAPVVAESSRFRLTGVMAPKAAGHYGVALIAVDGKAPRAFQVGATVDANSSLVLQSVSLRSASLGAGGAPPSFTLELPLPVPPATGTLPSMNNNGAAPPPGQPPMPGLQNPAPQPNFQNPGMPPPPPGQTAPAS